MSEVQRIESHEKQRSIASLRDRWLVVAVVLNLAIWHLGLYMNSFGGAVDRIGGLICNVTWVIAGASVPILVIYSGVRRWLLPVRRWDLLGPSSAVVAFLIVYLELALFGTVY